MSVILKGNKSDYKIGQSNTQKINHFEKNANLLEIIAERKIIG